MSVKGRKTRFQLTITATQVLAFTYFTAVLCNDFASDQHRLRGENLSLPTATRENLRPSVASENCTRSLSHITGALVCAEHFLIHPGWLLSRSAQKNAYTYSSKLQRGLTKAYNYPFLTSTQGLKMHGTLSYTS